MVITENVPLAPLTTLNVGGPARFFVEANTIAEVTEAVAFSQSKNLPLFVLGGGSNVVISDAGWPGLVLKIGVTGINHRHGHDEVVFEAGAGEDWDKFVGSRCCPQLRWHRMPERDSWKRWRNSGAECRRLRAGSFADN